MPIHYQNDFKHLTSYHRAILIKGKLLLNQNENCFFLPPSRPFRFFFELLDELFELLLSLLFQRINILRTLFYSVLVFEFNFNECTFQTSTDTHAHTPTVQCLGKFGCYSQNHNFSIFFHQLEDITAVHRCHVHWITSLILAFNS